jgi:hypothetical protein
MVNISARDLFRSAGKKISARKLKNRHFFHSDFFKCLETRCAKIDAYWFLTFSFLFFFECLHNYIGVKKCQKHVYVICDTEIFFSINTHIPGLSFYNLVIIFSSIWFQRIRFQMTTVAMRFLPRLGFMEELINFISSKNNKAVSKANHNTNHRMGHREFGIQMAIGELDC